MTDTFVHPGAAASLPGLPGLASVEEHPADRTLKADVLGELKRQIHRPTVILAVPSRPGWTVEYDPTLNADLLREWTKVSTDSRTGETDLFNMALLVIAGQCRAIHRDGKPVQLDGQALTFTSPAIAELYGSTDVTVTIREFYGNDTTVGSVYQRILQEAQAGSLDPTTGSSV